MHLWIVAAGVGLAAPAARADHHGMMASTSDDVSSLSAAVSLVAASYSTTSYIGNYQGVIPAVSWGSPAFAIGATFSLYRLEENGFERFGPGDVSAHGAYRLVHGETVSAGVAAMISAPTGDPAGGLGMGHPMAMPAAWAAWTFGQTTLAANVGFARALVAGSMSSHHDHGAWPIVEPMNLSELTWSGGCDIALGDGLHGGAGITGGIPIGEPGHDLVVAAARVGWSAHRIETAVELQAGLVGDPFTLRGLVESALHF